MDVNMDVTEIRELVKTGMKVVRAEPLPVRSESSGSIPDDVRLWIADVRDKLEHCHRDPITVNEALRLLWDSADLTQTHNCYKN